MASAPKQAAVYKKTSVYAFRNRNQSSMYSQQTYNFTICAKKIRSQQALGNF
jgi:hypothetical protein